MPKYLLRANYTESGLNGLIKEGGSKRREAATKAIEGLGGKVEAFYYGFGDDDAYVILESPDDVTAAAVCLAVGASGAVTTSTTALLSPEDVDAAIKKSVDYRPPGG